ncbi:peptidoglycan-binding domain-containing protein [Actinomyces mediterranea]|uniref:peptidoglycan-binding domain-containing protein n=1 Tax=Actinomyces mediterranea TaxID=1871028 RepID=UPI00097112C9|nr:hypothetical protein [Actinomyces mediterranea]
MRQSYLAWGSRILVIVVAVALGAVSAAVALLDATPTELSAAQSTTTVPLTERHVDDPIDVELVPRLSPAASLKSPASGVINRFDCAAGKKWESGEVLVEIDGQQRYVIATSEPLWRSLTEGDQGTDVRAFQEELNRLGFPLAVDGVVGQRTIRAAADLLKLTSDERTQFTSIPRERFVWIPSQEIQVSTCVANLGSAIEEGGELVNLGSHLVALTPKETPRATVDGDRIIVFDELTLAADSDGAVVDSSALDSAESSPSFAKWAATTESRNGTIAAKFLLAEPVSVYSVPPGAIYDLQGPSGCVADGSGTPFEVTVVSSQLGSSLVQFPGGDAPASVSSPAGQQASCR